VALWPITYKSLVTAAGSVFVHCAIMQLELHEVVLLCNTEGWYENVGEILAISLVFTLLTGIYKVTVTTDIGFTI